MGLLALLPAPGGIRSGKGSPHRRMGCPARSKEGAASMKRPLLQILADLAFAAILGLIGAYLLLTYL